VPRFVADTNVFSEAIVGIFLTITIALNILCVNYFLYPKLVDFCQIMGEIGTSWVKD